MKQIFVQDLKSNMEIMDYFMVKSIGIRVGSNQKQYLDLQLADKTGDLSAKKWDISPDEEPALSAIKEGELIKVKAQVTEWQGQKQLKITKIRKTSPQDQLDLKDFVKAAPEGSEEMYQYIVSVAESMEDPDLRQVCLYLLTTNRDRLMYYPAAAKNHHSEFGGLLWHIKRMLMTGEGIARVYPILNRDLLLTGVIIHDMEKLEEIESTEMGVATGYSAKGQLLGHIVQGVTMIDRLCRELDIGEEKALVLEHMVLSHHYEPDYGSPKKPMFPEAEVLHYLDILDARMYDMEEAMTGLEPGAFSERIRTLDGRKVYKPEF